MDELYEEQQHYRVDWFPLHLDDEEVMSEWYPPFIEPMHIGVYNASAFGVRDMLRFWNGFQWSLPWTASTLPHDREMFKRMTTKTVGIYWRGLTEKPEGGNA
jgi:hypothetical protein